MTNNQHYVVKFKITPRLKQDFQNVYTNGENFDIPEKIKVSAQNKFENPIELEELLWLQTKLPQKIHFYKLLEECNIILPELKIEPRNPELEARIQKLMKLEEERKYREMTKNVDSVRFRHPEDSIAYQGKFQIMYHLKNFDILLFNYKF